MVGDKVSLMTGGRPDNPVLLLPKADWEQFQKNPPAQTMARINGGPQAEWLNAIKGDGPMPLSNFEYASRLTEMALVGVLAQRVNEKIVYDAANMKVTDRPEYDRFLKEPAREGWRYGENLDVKVRVSNKKG